MMKKLLALLFVAAGLFSATPGHSAVVNPVGGPATSTQSDCAAFSNTTGNGLQDSGSPCGTGAVSSVFGRTGAVVSATNDYTFGQIAGQALLTQIANIGANTILGNATASAAAPTALSIPSCSGGANALIWTTSTGFGCNTISGSGTVTSSTAGELAWYSATGTVVIGNANANMASGLLSLGTSATTAGGVKLFGATSGSVQINPPAVAGTSVLTFPVGTDTLSDLAGTQTLTNKTISGASNTLSAIALASLATETANTIVGNATGSAASPTALAIPSCSAGTSALTWTTSVGFGCNTISGGSVSVTAATSAIVITPSPGTGTFTVGCATLSSTQIGCGEVDNQTTVATSGKISTSVPDRTATTTGAETILSTDMGGQVNYNGASLVVTTTAVATGYLQAGMTVTVCNQSSSNTLSLSGIVQTVNGYNTATPLPVTSSGAAACINLTSNGTTLDAIPTAVATSSAVAVRVVSGGSTDTLLTTDCGNIVVYTVATAITTTLPDAFSAGCSVALLQDGTGQITVARQTSGALVPSGVTATTSGQWSIIGVTVMSNGGSAAQWHPTGELTPGIQASTLGGTGAAAPHPLGSATAPTISSGFGTSPSIVASNGTFGYTVNVGTGGTASSGVIGLPTAPTAWACQVHNQQVPTTTVANTVITAATTASITVGNFNSADSATAWGASAVLVVTCIEI